MIEFLASNPGHHWVSSPGRAVRADQVRLALRGCRRLVRRPAGRYARSAPQPAWTVKALGVVLFCYAVELAAGSTFLSDLKRRRALMLAGIVGLVVMAGFGIGVGHLIGLVPPHLRAVRRCSYPAIDAALKATDGSPDTRSAKRSPTPPVVVALVMVAMVATKRWLKFATTSRWPRRHHRHQHPCDP